MAHNEFMAKVITNKLDNILCAIDSIENDLRYMNEDTNEEMKDALTELFRAYVAIADCSSEIYTVYQL